MVRQLTDADALAGALAEAAKYREALEWYADERNWRSFDEVSYPHDTEALADRGAIARAALAPDGGPGAQSPDPAANGPQCAQDAARTSEEV